MMPSGCTGIRSSAGFAFLEDAHLSDFFTAGFGNVSESWFLLLRGLLHGSKAEVRMMLSSFLLARIQKLA